MNKLLKLTLGIFLTLIFFACNDSEKTITSESDTNAEILKKSFDLYSKMKSNNENLVMNLSLNNEGKIVASYEKNANFLAKTSPEKLCEDETYSDEFANCVQENVEQGICVSIMTCAYCAYECEGGGSQ